MKNYYLRISLLVCVFVFLFNFSSFSKVINIDGDYKVTKSLTINDTLIITGDFDVGAQATLTIGPNAVIIVGGDFTASNKVNISASGIFIIGGSLDIKGSSKGSFKVPGGEVAKVYIGGDVSIHKGDPNDYPVLDKNTGDHKSSNHSYGNFIDLKNEFFDVFDKYKDVICGAGIDPGSIGLDQSLCGEVTPDKLTELKESTENSYQWYSSFNSVDPETGKWDLITGATGKEYDPHVLTKTNSFYRQVQKGNGCVANSNVVTITVTPTPAPIGIFFND